MKYISRPGWDLTTLILAFVVAVGFFFLNYSNNLGFTPDSVSYYEVAKNMANGKGITDFKGNPVHHWPPGFSVVLATSSNLLSLSPLKVGIILNSILLFLTLVLLYLIFKKFQIPESVAFILCVLYSLSPIGTIYILYLSEGLFILFILAGILLILEWRIRKNLILVGLAAITIGLSFWIRYAGLYFIAGIAVYLFLQAKEWKFRILQPLLFLFTSLLIILPWLLFLNKFKTESRYLNPDALQIRPETLNVFLKTVGSWIIGNKWGGVLIISLVIIFLLINRKRLSFQLNPSPLWWVNAKTEYLLPGILILTYVALIFLSAFLVHNIEPDSRILSPIYPFFLCILGLLFKAPYENQKSRRVVWFFFFLIFTGYATRTIPVFIDHYRTGSGFTATKFSQSKVLAHTMSGNYSSKELIVNDNFIFRIHGNNMNLQNLPFDGDLTGIEGVKEKLAAKEAVLVYLDHVNWRAYFIDRDVILREFSEFKIRRFSDGFIIE